MKFRKLRLTVVTGALGAAMGIACAQQVGVGAGSSVGTTPAQAKTAVDIQGNQALTSEAAVAGRPIQGSPGTQSGPAVSQTVAMGASGSMGPSRPNQYVAGLSSSQLRALERYEALR